MGYVEVSVENQIAFVEFYHPKSNSFPTEQLQKLTRTFHELSQNDAVTCIVLSSKGKVFCAGASFDELLEVKNATEGKQFFFGFKNLLLAMVHCKKIIIGLVQGKTIGGGVGIVAACDYVFGTEEIACKLSEIQIGIGPFVIEPVISHKIGKQRMFEMTWNPNQWYDAEWAKNCGLINEIVSDEELAQKSKEKALELVKYNPEALYSLKEIAWEGKENWEEIMTTRAMLSGNYVLSNFTKEQLQKFKENK